jgi:hypothetical protein
MIINQNNTSQLYKADVSKLPPPPPSLVTECLLIVNYDGGTGYIGVESLRAK